MSVPYLITTHPETTDFLLEALGFIMATFCMLPMHPMMNGGKQGISTIDFDVRCEKGGGG